MSCELSVIILTWNGLALLKENLDKVISEIRSCGFETEIFVVDNGSSDGSREYLRSEYGGKGVGLIFFDENLGFSKANNIVAGKARGEYLLFLNNDIILDRNFCAPLIAKIKSGEDIFAVMPKMLRFDEKTIDDGIRYARFYSGLLDIYLVTDEEYVNRDGITLFACGAAMFCRRDIFFSLGGFDEVYTPYAWEDLDISYRAWKRGYKILYTPDAVCYHKREATTRTLFSNIFFISLMWRNKFIFIWKNITDSDYFRKHFFLLPVKLIKFLFNGRWRYVAGFFRALPRLPYVIAKRRAEKREAVFTDREILGVTGVNSDFV